jgi:hypothetical protein
VTAFCPNAEPLRTAVLVDSATTVREVKEHLKTVLGKQGCRALTGPARRRARTTPREDLACFVNPLSGPCVHLPAGVDPTAVRWLSLEQWPASCSGGFTLFGGKATLLADEARPVASYGPVAPGAQIHAALREGQAPAVSPGPLAFADVELLDALTDEADADELDFGLPFAPATLRAASPAPVRWNGLAVQQ